jgi:DnaJ-class molecular chaperone
MPIFGSDSYGDLYVEYKVVLPLELSPTMRRSKSLLPLTTMNPMSISNPRPSELDRAFNGDYSAEGKKGGRDEL